jgi:hypothetical protein
MVTSPRNAAGLSHSPHQSRPCLREGHAVDGGQELDGRVDRVGTIADDAQDTYVMTNNHNLGKAVVNAFQLKALLTGQSVSPPQELVETYPELRDLK